MPMAENPRYRKPRSHSQNQRQPISGTDPIPSLTLSSILFSNSTTTANDYSASASASAGTGVAGAPKKKNFTSSAFRGMGCRASSQVSVPAMIRASADWEEKKKSKKKMLRSKKNKQPVGAFGGNVASVSASGNNNNGLSSSCVGGCGPGIGFSTDAASVDCVLSRRPVSGRGIPQRERPSCSVRRMIATDDDPFLDSDSTLAMSQSHPHMSGSRHHRHRRNDGYRQGLAEVVMLQSNMMLGGRSEGLSRHGGLRLDVDNMSYEELLELGDRIGHVSTGLKEDEISCCLRKTKLFVMGNLSSLMRATGTERKCSICQEEYEADEDVGEMNCGHIFHVHCIRQWLLQKNWCPVCKTSAVSRR